MHGPFDLMGSMEENAAWSSVMPAKEHDDAPTDDVEPGSVLFQSSAHPPPLLALAPHTPHFA
uniref:Uncharacterized protein n=1 Tax=Triticum urartu TaxID=4572 RepID=A0A8R7QEW1_TRIUA